MWNSLTLATKVTIGRILLVPFFISTVLYLSPNRLYLRWVALALFSIAVVSDVIDGYIARVYHQKSKAGAILDPLADKALLISAFLCLYARRGSFEEFAFPLWFVVAIISRDIILLIGAMIIQLVTGQLEIEPNRSGKTTAFLQVTCVLGMLLQWSFTKIFWYAAIVATLVSGVIYIKEGIKRINEHSTTAH
ncbi:MAG: CDP-alcohol phosphatidyltransferase family protein [Candidatus Omnitrophica bacterium]|nr:CDP-alcohol phosphatidyltransferase family protein [Candidatus Omnitrophota bacterium]